MVAIVEDIDLPMKKASEYRYLEAFNLSNGRCERIRTFYPLHPMQVLVNSKKLTKSQMSS